jgi:hypothetical protein
VTIRATLYNYDGGIPVNASETITITFDTTYSDCLGSGANSLILQILPNNSYGERVYSDLTYEPCPFDQQCNPVSITVNGVSDISPSGYVQCSVPITPTPTPSPSPTEATITFNCNNGFCEEVFDGSGLYSTLSECQNNCTQTVYSCKENEFSPCLDQASPCSPEQIQCSEGPTSS